MPQEGASPPSELDFVSIARAGNIVASDAGPVDGLPDARADPRRGFVAWHEVEVPMGEPSRALSGVRASRGAFYARPEAVLEALDVDDDEKEPSGETP